ncbi:hypothetical protein Tco_0766407 [Tanacetum coccineum]
MYVSLPSTTIARPWFATIGYSGEIGVKGTLKKSCLPPRVKVDYAKLIREDIIHKLSKKTREKALKPDQTKGPPFTDHMKAIYNLDVPVDSKAPKPSSQTEERHPNPKLANQKKKPSPVRPRSKAIGHPSPPTPVVGEMHKEAQQAVGGLTSLGAIGEEGAHHQLSSADSTAKADPENSALNDSIPAQQVFILNFDSSLPSLLTAVYILASCLSYQLAVVYQILAGFSML